VAYVYYIIHSFSFDHLEAKKKRNMSHQSGITGMRKIIYNRLRNISFVCCFVLATDSLREKFAEMKDGHIRVVVVVIEDG